MLVREVISSHKRGLESRQDVINIRALSASFDMRIFNAIVETIKEKIQVHIHLVSLSG